MNPAGSLKPPPEERLLRLIRGKGAKPPAAADPPAAPAGVGIAAGPRWVEGPARTGRIPWTRIAVGGFGIILAIETVALFIMMIRPLPVISAPIVVASPPADAAAQEALPEEIPTLSAAVARPLFAPPAGTSPEGGSGLAAGSKRAPSESAKLLASRLTLMGIVSGNPAQAIFEDTQTKKTYFVSTGQTVLEGATLEQVLENRVILDLQGEKIELSL